MTEEVKEGYYCYLCEYTTEKNSDWLKHQNTKRHLRNGKPKTTTCSICEFSTSTHWNLKLHILSHHSTKEERQKYKYYCEVCDLVFFCSTYKNKHISGKFHKNRELCLQFQKELDDKQKLETS
jgi:hypothetical protein